MQRMSGQQDELPLLRVVDVLTKLLFIIFVTLRQTGKVLSDCRKANVAPIFSNGQTCVSGSHRTVTFMLGKPWSMLSQSMFLEEEGGWEQSAWNAAGECHRLNTGCQHRKGCDRPPGVCWKTTPGKGSF